MTRYIPPNDADFLAWMNNFISVLNANLATFGLVAADLTPLTNARNDFQTKLGNFQTAETAFRTASEAKKTSRNTAEPLFRQMAQRINRHPAMTNALRAQLGLTVPKPRQRRGVGPEIPGVRLEVDAGRVVVHFGTNPDDERLNGKPEWALGANKCLCVGFSTCPPPNLLVRVHQFGTELLRQGRLSPRRRGRAGAPFCPHPLCPPLPQGGRGGTRCRAHCRAPLHPSPTQWERGWG
jgi:hypothetical protein